MERKKALTVIWKERVGPKQHQNHTVHSGNVLICIGTVRRDESEQGRCEGGKKAAMLVAGKKEGTSTREGIGGKQGKLVTATAIANETFFERRR